MSFDVTPTRIGDRRSRWLATAVAVAAVALVTVAVVGARFSPPTGVSGLAADDRIAASSATAPDGAVAPGPTSPTWMLDQALASERALAATPQPIPKALTCHDVSPTLCRTIARAALDALPADGPRAIAIAAWPNLLCSDSLDCPLDRLKASKAIGSAIVAFADGSRQAWINVVQPVSGPDRVPDVVRPDAWAIR